MVDDEKLIRRIRSGDPDALEELIRKYYNDIYTYCYRKMGRKSDAEDVTQEVFLHFCRNFDSYVHRGKCRNYLYIIARNLCADALRAKAPVPLSSVEVEDPAESDAGERQIDAADSVQTALKRLPGEQKEVILLHFYHDLKLEEIAQIMDAGLSVTKYRLYRGLKTLSNLLSKEDWL